MHGLPLVLPLFIILVVASSLVAVVSGSGLMTKAHPWSISAPPNRQQGRTAKQQADWDRNRNLVANANRRRAAFDFVLYGDSITAFLGRDPETWRKHFRPKHSAVLGVGGDAIEHLAGRMLTTERLSVPPKAAAFRIGINNFLRNGQTVDQMAALMDQFLPLAKRLLPGTRLYLLALLRTTRNVDTASANTRLQALARKHGFGWLTCGTSLDPMDRRVFSDGLHPTAAGHDMILTCLKASIHRV